MELSLDNISLSYTNSYADSSEFAIKNLSLNIENGSWNFIVGETGSGKSTLLQAMGALLPIKEGEIFWRGNSIKNNENLKKFRNNVGIMFQYTEKQFFNYTIKDEITFSLRKKQVPSEKIEKELEGVIELLNIPKNILERHPLEISGGQKRFVALASILIENPSLLLLDEPTCGLDVQAQKLFFDILQKFRKEGRTIIQISHMLEDVLNYGDRAILLESGKILRSGKPRDVLSGIQTESLEIFHALKNMGMSTDNFQNIDHLLEYIGSDDFVK